MELNFEIIRILMCKIAESVNMNDNYELTPIRQSWLIEGFPDKDRKNAYHSLLMLHQKGFLFANPINNNSEILDLTVEGYEFYNLIKWSDVWDELNNRLAKISNSLTFDIVAENS